MMNERQILGKYIEEYSVRNKSAEALPVYSVTNDKGFCQGYFDKDVSSKDKSGYKIVPRGYLAYNPSRINVGSIACQEAEDRVIVSPLYVVFGVSGELYNPYLMYFLKSQYANDYINAYARGAVRNNFGIKKMCELTLPVPSLASQQGIVEELDAIHVILDAKNEQLCELDNLAQAIFYSMFGDPALNDKGWNIMTIREAFPFIKNGANIKQTKGADGLPITRIETLSGGRFNRDRLGYANIYDTEKYAPYYLETGDILMSHINGKAYLGRAVMYTKVGEEQIIHGMNLLRLKANKDIIDPCYATYYFKTDDFKAKIVSIRKDAINQSSFSMGDLSKLSMPCPPLDLQQVFASKISAIEQQKELIRASIAETEALLAARMQHYFD